MPDSYNRAQPADLERQNKEDTMVTAYCMKCRKKVEIKNPRQITLKNGRPAVQGICSICGIKVFRIGKG